MLKTSCGPVPLCNGNEMLTKRQFARCWHSWRFWLIAAVAAGILWRLTDYILRFPVWDDEASLGLNILHRGYLGLLRPLRYGQVCPIGFLWGSKFLMTCFGTDVWVLRFVPMVAGIAAVVLAWPITRRVAGRRAGLLATALIACSLATNRFGTDFKPYSLDLLMSLGIIGLALSAIRRPWDYRPVLFLALLTPVAIVLSYPSVFVLGAALTALLPTLWRRRGTARQVAYSVWAVITVGCFAAIYLTVIHGQMHHTHSFMQEFWKNAFPPHGPALFLWLIDAHISNMMSYPFGGSKGIALLIAPLALLGVWRLWKKRRRAEWVLLVGPFVLTFFAAWLHKYPYGADARVEQHLVVSITLLAALGAVTLGTLAVKKSRNINLWRYTANIPVAVMIIFAAIMIGKDICYPWRTPAPLVAQNFVRHVFQHTGPHTQVLIVNKHPQRYSVLLSWQLAVAPRRFSILPRLAHGWTAAAGTDVWLLHFHFSHPLPISPEIVRHFQQNIGHGRIAANVTRRLFEPFSGHPPVYMQAIHIVPQAP